MRLRTVTDTSLHYPDELEGYVAWHEIEVQDLDENYDLETIGTARAGVVNAFYLNDKVRRTKHPDRDELEPLVPLVRECVAHEIGLDVLYFTSIKIDEKRQGRNVELAVVLRACDLFGMGCSFAAIRAHTPEEIEYWAQIGFVKTPGSDDLLHVNLNEEPPAIIEDEDEGTFHLVPRFRRWVEQKLEKN